MTVPHEPECSHLAMRSRLTDVPIGEPLTLYTGPMALRGEGGATVPGDGTVSFAFVPDLSVRFSMESAQPFALTAEEHTAEMVSAGRTAGVIVLEAERSEPSGVTSVHGVLTGDLKFGASKADGSPEPIGRVRFHVLNFHQYHGETLYMAEGGKTSSWAGRARFGFGDWVVTLDALPDVGERRKRVKVYGGHAVTHLGDLRRRDGKTFGQQDAADVLEFLYWLLSFASGSRCGCVLSSGWRYLDTPLWEDWGPQVTRPGRGGLSWFADNLPNECLGIAGGFYSLWRDNDKRDWLRLAVSIYADSNRNTSGTDLELTKAQVALELLCWVVLREENAVLSEGQLDKLPAADRIRRLLSWCGIPLPIPAPLGELAKAFAAGAAAGADGPQAATQIRNSVVHPTRKNRDKLRGFSNLAKFEAWQLSMWYVELVLLKLFGYAGRYDNRLERKAWAGTYERVPWAAP